MKLLVVGVGILAVLAPLHFRAQNKTAEESNFISGPKLERMPESLEVRFALSALPPHLRDNATTYVLDPAKGYVLNHKGTNGVSCIVVRSDWQWPEHPFRDDIFWAVGYKAGSSGGYEEIWDCRVPQSYPIGSFLHARSGDARFPRPENDEYASLHVLCP
jgi:hypothetical protein